MDYPGLSGIRPGPFRARNEAKINSRITSTDNEGDYQTSVSRITTSGFSRTHNGGAIQCINMMNTVVIVREMAIV